MRFELNETKLNNGLIDESIKDFPLKGKWKSFSLDKLQGNSTSLRWKEAEHIPQTGGLYAFSIPLDEFNGGTYTIELDGPQQSKIEFWFSANDFPPAPNNHFVLYVGKTTNLYNRLQLHLRKTKTATQVLYGMEKIFKTEYEHVKIMLLQSGLFYYMSLPGDVNCVNRDMIELGLCVKYRSPINIKSER